MGKMYCFECNGNVDFEKKIFEEMYEYRNQKFKIKETKYFCKKCNNELVDENMDESLKNIYNGYLGIYNLNINSFKNIRTSLNLTQELFSKALGWGRKSIIRYENFDEIPSGEYLKIYVRLNEDKDYILECLDLNRKNLTEEEYYQILEKLRLNLDIKSRNTILYLLEGNDLFLLPLLKNLFAVDFLSYQKNSNTITSFKYAKLPCGPVVDQYTKIINIMLKSGEIKEGEGIIINGELKTPYKCSKKVDLRLFTENELAILKEVKQKLANKTAKELSDWSHLFKGWIETPKGKIIDFKKREIKK